MNTDTRQGKKTGEPGKRRWLWPLLIVSLALNLLFVGLIAGSVWFHGGSGKRHHVFTGAVEQLMKDLPAAKKMRAKELLDTYRAGVKPRRQQVSKTRRAARASVVAETYDESMLVEELALLRQLRTDEHEALHLMFLGLLKELSVEERKQLLANIRAGFRKRRGWRRRVKRDKD